MEKGFGKIVAGAFENHAKNKEAFDKTLEGLSIEFAMVSNDLMLMGFDPKNPDLKTVTVNNDPNNKKDLEETLEYNKLVEQYNKLKKQIEEMEKQENLLHSNQLN